jgi:glycosyltransferase involved in cell wall biosynthesis
MDDGYALSIVIPAYNEVESLPVLVADVVGVAQTLSCRSWELILVDDGSTEGTAEVMRRLAAENRRIKAVLLRTNFGKSAALMAGFREAGGDIVITMDADLQDDPREIPSFIREIQSGYDLVSGWKKERDDPLEKRLASRFFNAVVRKVSGVKLHDHNCGFKAYRRWCVADLQLRGNQHRFVAALLSWRGARIGEIPVAHHKRRHGASKYGVARYFHGVFDLATIVLLTKFSQSPLYFFGLLSVPFLTLGMLIAADLLINEVLYLISPELGSQLTLRPLLILAVFLILVGLLIFLIGLLAELVLRLATFEQSYWVREVVGDRRAAAKSAPLDAAGNALGRRADDAETARFAEHDADRR